MSNKVDKNTLQDLYINKKYSIPKIKEILFSQGINISQSSLYNLLKKYNIKTYSLKESALIRNNLPHDFYEKSFFNYKLKEWTDGFLLGDGFITIDKNNKLGRATISVKYKEFCEYLISGFNKYNPSKIKYYKYSHTKGSGIYTSSTSFHPDLYKQRKRWYPDDRKKIPEDIEITPISVLLWYLGDGSLVKKDKTVSIRLSTDCFLSEDIDCILIPKLQELNINCHRSNENRILINNDSIPDFFNLIGKNSPIKCYDYKFDLPEWRFSARRIKFVCDSLKLDYNRVSYLIKNNIVPYFRDGENGIPRFLDCHIKLLKHLANNNIINKDLEYLKNYINIYFDNSFEKQNNKTFFERSLKKYNDLNSSIDRDLIVNNIFYYYRYIYGFPYYNLSDKELEKDMDNLVSTEYNKICSNDVFNINTVGYRTSNHWHKHMFQAKNKNFQFSPYECFLNDDKLIECIKYNLENNKKCNHANMRKILKTIKGSRSVGNFSPLISKYLYTKYCPENGRILDPCSGFSGRFIGSICSNKNFHYTGIDINKNTVDGNINCGKFYLNKKDIFGNNKYNFSYNFILGKAQEEMINIKDNSYDLIFTSPPYFDLEDYNNSCELNEYENWKNEFLFNIINQSYRILNEKGRFILNIKNIPKFNMLDDSLQYCLDIGFNLEKKYKMQVPKNEYNRKRKGDNFEFIVVFNR